MNIKNQKYLIALAGLFHDIGKFYQRTNIKNDSFKDYEKFKYQHAQISHFVIDNQLREGLRKVFSEDEIQYIIKGTYHHKPNDEIEKILQKADWASSSEREEEKIEYSSENLSENQTQDYKNFIQKNQRLISVFSNIKLNQNEKQQKNKWFYKLSPLKIDKDIFPKDYESTYINSLSTPQVKEKFIKENLGDYNEIWEKFKTEFNENLKSINIKFSEQPEKVFSLIYHILYKYLWCIPASTFDMENRRDHFPDISLFDHSRVLSAIACCYYDYYQIDKNINDDKNIFLQLKGDISGIQNFIYNVYEGEGGVAKILRGRSFFISMLPEIIARYILNELNYPISNLLYCGGGVFEILLANTKQNKDKLKEIEKEINKYLAEKFEADLGLIIGYYEYTPKELKENYSDVLIKLNENLDLKKKQKFIRLLEEENIEEILNNKTKNIKNKKLCPTCRSYLIEEDKHICNVCEEFKNIGNYLPRTKYLIFSKSILPYENEKSIIKFDKFGTIYLKSDNNDLNKLLNDKNTIEILKINNTDFDIFNTGFKFLAKSIPILKKDISKDSEVVYEKRQIAPFEIIADLSKGDKRIGLLMMDVDNLGSIFSKGLSKISISRIATLSRMLDLFFSGYLNEITKEESEDSETIENNFYTLYAGGDDLFIISAWDKTIDIAKQINKEFKNYVCQNPDIHLSAGYIQTKPKSPIRFSAELVKQAEKESKSRGKNRICVLGDVIEWDNLENILKISKELSDYIESDTLQRSFIYKLHRLKEEFLKDRNKNYSITFPYATKINHMIYPYLHYYIARNIKEKKIREKVAELFLKDENLLFKSTFIVNYTALKTRKV